MKLNSPTSRDDLESTLLRSFVEGVTWPLDRASLAALSDMGLSINQIAKYFLVEPSEVRSVMDTLGPIQRGERTPHDGGNATTPGRSSS